MLEIIKKIFFKYFYKFTGCLLGALLVILTLIIFIDPFVSKYVTESSICLIIYGSILIIWTIIWFCIVYYLPKNNTKKIGILIAISTENDKQKLRIKKDFVGGIGELINKHNLSHLFNTINLSEYKAEKVGQILTNYLTKKSEIFSKINDKTDIELKKEFKKVKEFKKFKRLNNRLNCHFFV